MPTSTPSGSIRRRPRSLAQEVLDSLTEQIRSGALAPGVKLPSEFELTQTQGVSRTVIREAILRLQASGLVETRQGIGTFVLENVERAVELESTRLQAGRDVFAILELRTCIETEAAGLAAQRADARDLENIFQRTAGDRGPRAGSAKMPRPKIFSFTCRLPVPRAIRIWSTCCLNSIRACRRVPTWILSAIFRASITSTRTFTRPLRVARPKVLAPRCACI